MYEFHCMWRTGLRQPMTESCWSSCSEKKSTHSFKRQFDTTVPQTISFVVVFRPLFNFIHGHSVAVCFLHLWRLFYFIDSVSVEYFYSTLIATNRPSQAYHDIALCNKFPFSDIFSILCHFQNTSMKIFATLLVSGCIIWTYINGFQRTDKTQFEIELELDSFCFDDDWMVHFFVWSIMRFVDYIGTRNVEIHWNCNQITGMSFEILKCLENIVVNWAWLWSYLAQ